MLSRLAVRVYSANLWTYCLGRCDAQDMDSLALIGGARQRLLLASLLECLRALGDLQTGDGNDASDGVRDGVRVAASGG